MAYTIGSAAGKKKAEEMTAGESWTNTKDGSTWTKQADGSVSVKHNGVTTNNAYKPTTTGSSGQWYSDPDIQASLNAALSGGTTTTTNTATTGGSTSSANSQYSKGSTDYGTLGKQQMADGADWKTVLATYNARNNKALTTAGLEKYANDDIQAQMWDYILANMGSSDAASDYLSGFNNMYTEEAPTYNAKYDASINALLDKILNREDFSYDAQSDPLYQQYAAMYRREGDRAMRDTMAEAAATAGGMNSYAITAAQQASDYYNAQLSDKIPELYQLAYEMYLNDKESMVQDLGLLQGMDATQYGRYRDTMQDYYNDKNFAYGLYADSVAQGNWQKNFDYNQAINERDFSYNATQDTLDREQQNKEWDNYVAQQALDNQRYDTEWQNTLSQQDIANKWKQTEWDNYVAQQAIDNNWKQTEWDNYVAQQALENKRYDDSISREDAASAKAQARDEVYALLELGKMPSSALLKAAGVDEAYASAYVAGIQAAAASAGSSSSSKGSSSSSSQKKKQSDGGNDLWGEDNPTPKKDDPAPKKDDSGFEGADYSHLGIGPMTEETYMQIAQRGGLVEDANGKIQWAKGWNKNNWREKLKQSPGNLAIDNLMSGLFNL